MIVDQVQVLREKNAEIERLQAALELQGTAVREYQQVIEAFRAEIERLRSVLGVIAGHRGFDDYGHVKMAHDALAAGLSVLRQPLISP